MALKPIEDWIPAMYQKNASLVVGIEYDKLDGVRWLDWTLDLQFATWSVMAKPGHIFLEHTVERVMDELRKLAQKQGCTVSEIKASYHEVLATTGPALFTEAILEGLSYTTGTDFGAHNLTGMTEPRLVGDVLILPINAFGSGQLHSNSGDPDSDSAIVQHLFKGTWKKDHSFQESLAQEALQQKSDAAPDAQASSPLPEEEAQPKAEEKARSRAEEKPQPTAEEKPQVKQEEKAEPKSEEKARSKPEENPHAKPKEEPQAKPGAELRTREGEVAEAHIGAIESNPGGPVGSPTTSNP